MARFLVHPRISDIPATSWDALTAGQPFMRHAYLAALEETGCVGEGSGWHPLHAALWEGDSLRAAMPLYLKQHSWGEYVFDWAWAEAFERHGIAYYPKALCAVPFAPVPGARLLGADEDARDLLAQVLAFCREQGLSSMHLLFPEARDLALGESLGMQRREGLQFHWHSAGESDFEGFLARLNHEKRKKIRQERRKLGEAGVSLRWLEGAAIAPEHWAFMERCYRTTYALHGSSPYLNLDFFLQLGAQLPEHCVLVLAERDSRPIAASLMLRDATALYGRYWGAVEHVPGLHFEACYYQGIAYAIARGLHRFEGGAQGEHKLARGMEAVRTHSLHWIADRAFADAIGRYLEREREGVGAAIDELQERSPFKATAPALSPTPPPPPPPEA
ncbi:GNAT family N-acetyltransferase [Niveibacterium sp. SC-1]|uniref:GNAT family N-acetyltransferase n=1 Tax=Niveibacterium sp. SC-1 TaxID=3135646 RepID=UPI0031200A94